MAVWCSYHWIALSRSMDPKILKGVGAKIVILTFYDQVVKVGSGWVEQEFVLIIIARLSNGTRLPNE
jgi:hypothetical protein